MKVKDLIEQEIDIDVYDDVCEELGIAFCGPLYLTEQGKEKFADVLDYEIQIGNECAIVCIDDAEDKVWKNRLKLAKEFFYAAAGYCDDDDWNVWFSDEPIPFPVPAISRTENSERSRTLTVTLHVEDGNAVAEFLEGETGERLSVVVPYSPDEHPEFNEAVGNELYSWLEMLMEEQDG